MRILTILQTRSSRWLECDFSILGRLVRHKWAQVGSLRHSGWVWQVGARRLILHLWMQVGSLAVCCLEYRDPIVRRDHCVGSLSQTRVGSLSVSRRGGSPNTLLTVGSLSGVGQMTHSRQRPNCEKSVGRPNCEKRPLCWVSFCLKTCWVSQHSCYNWVSQHSSHNWVSQHSCHSWVSV